MIARALALAVALSACLGIFPSPTIHAQPAREPAAVVEDVLKLSGLDDSLESLAMMVRRIVGDLSAADRVGDRALVTPLLEQEISPAKLRAAMTAHFTQHFDARTFEQLVGTLRTPLMRRITELEVASLRASDDAARAYVDAAARQPDGGERVRLAQRLETAMAATETVAAIIMAATRGSFTVLNPLLPPAQRVTPQALDADRGRLEPKLRPGLHAALAYTYREATLDEVRRYADYLEGDGRWFVTLQRDATVRAAETTAEAAMRRLMRMRTAPRT